MDCPPFMALLVNFGLRLIFIFVRHLKKESAGENMLHTSMLAAFR